MIRRISLVRRRPGMTRQEFMAHWSGQHLEIVRQLPGLRGIRLNAVQVWIPDGGAWDGVGEIWFDSIEAAQAAFDTEPLASQLAEDRARFLGYAEIGFLDKVMEVPLTDAE